MAVFATACFFPPPHNVPPPSPPPSLPSSPPQPASATQLPTECICSNTINVTFADCLLAFYLNGNWALAAAAAAAAAAAPSSRFAGVPLCAVRLHPAPFPSAPSRGLPKRRPTPPAVAERRGVCACVCAHLCAHTCACLGRPGRSLNAIQERFLLGETLCFLLGFSKALILPEKKQNRLLL